jgi:hypothetical protein
MWAEGKSTTVTAFEIPHEPLIEFEFSRYISYDHEPIIADTHLLPPTQA